VETDFPASTSGTNRTTWDPGSLLAAITFTGDTKATGKDAVTLVAALPGWIGTDAKPLISLS
jgi:hypothetical protein